MRVTTRRSFFWEVNIVTPFVLFFAMCGALNSEYLLSTTIGALYGSGGITIFGNTLIAKSLFMMICKYGREFVLGYLLIISLAYWMRREEHGMKRTFAIALLAELGVEILRMTFIETAILAPWNLVFEVAGTLIAFLVVLIHEKKLF